MKVMCISNALSPKQRLTSAPVEPMNWPHLEIGKIYTVMGLAFNIDSPNGILVDIPGEDYVFDAPLCLFEVFDGRPSRYWEARKTSDHSLTFWPKAFYMEYFHDRLSDLEPECTAIYHEVRTQLESEFDELPLLRPKR